MLKGLTILYLITTVNSLYTYNTRHAFNQPWVRKSSKLSAEPRLLPDPAPNSVGNFFDNKTESMTFIQCYMLALGEIKGTQYGVGFPVDYPVMLTYFEGTELKPVQPDYFDYDHLLNHVSVQLDGYDLQLYRTPIVLTLQGEFEDEDLNSINSYGSIISKNVNNEVEEEEEEEEELTLEQLLAEEDLYEDYEDEDDLDDWSEDDDDDDDDDDDNDDDDDDNDDDDEGVLNEEQREFAEKTPDLTVMRAENPDISNIPEDAFVSEEDTKSLRKAHRKADRIMEYAADIKLIASFHHKKKNYHLVRLLEPMFIIGKRIPDIKGYYFTLLDDKESDEIRPTLEHLLLTRPQMDPSMLNESSTSTSSTKGGIPQKKIKSRRSTRSWKNKIEGKNENKGFNKNR